MVELNEGTLDRSLSILGEALGERFIQRTQLADFAHQRDGRCAFVAVTDTGAVVGIQTGRIMELDEFIASVPTDQRETVKSLFLNFGDHRIGALQSIVVTPTSSGQGIGTTLAKQMTDRLWDEGATAIVSVGWMDADGCRAQGVLERLGYGQLGDIPNYWTQDSIQNEYSCPSDGRPCHCEARLFVIRQTDFAE